MLRHIFKATMENVSSQPGESRLDPRPGNAGRPPRWGGGRAILGPVAILAASLLVALGIYFGFLGSSWVD